ncbi:MAG: c-type cytochrome biogenesis protein CcmI [Acidiferrobacteraceae bacterium]|nr:c-type cytochrome biogenesis protein CcmI [Acidiferrobacteraceae bacterium]|tara:strand:- start:149 stop:1414 length:1266 start_codon:yes stop_codon:yes gene_type:complete
MTFFWIAAIGMTISAVMLVVWPLFAKGKILDSHQNDMNFQLAKERLREWKLAKTKDHISLDEFESLREELEDNLALDLRSRGSVSNVSQPNIPLALTLAALLPLIAFLMYFQLGTPNSIAAPSSSSNSTLATLPASQSSVPPVADMLEQLRARLEDNPDDEVGWSILADAMMSLGRYSEAVKAYESWLNVVGDRPSVMVGYAYSLAMISDGDLNGRPTSILEKALDIDPKEPYGLWLAGVAAQERNDLVNALGYWYRLEPLIAHQSDQLRNLQDIISSTESVALKNGLILPNRYTSARSPNIDAHPIQDRLVIHISLDPDLSTLVSIGDTLFVYALGDGESRPVAAVRHTIDKWPVEIILDDTLSPMTSTSLFDYEYVTVNAHISRSGVANKSPGDLAALPATTKLLNNTPVKLAISEIIE